MILLVTSLNESIRLGKIFGVTYHMDVIHNGRSDIIEGRRDLHNRRRVEEVRTGTSLIRSLRDVNRMSSLSV